MVATAVTLAAVVLTPAAQAADRPPAITVQPASQTVSVGDDVTLVAASNDPSAKIQWQVSRDKGASWSPIPGGTGNTLVIPSITQDWSGAYVGASFTNDAGSVATTAALITVNPAGPKITQQPASIALPEGSDATFTVAAQGTAPLAVQWSRSNDKGASWSAIPGATGPRLVVKTVTSGDSGAQFRATVTSGEGVTVSAAATLTVTAATATLVLAPVGSVVAGDVEPGTTITYAAALTNSGRTAINGWTLVIKGSDGVVLAPADRSALAPGLPEPTADCTVTSTGLSCPLGSVAAESVGRVLVGVTIEPDAGPGAATVTAEVDAGGKATNVGAATITLTVAQVPTQEASPEATSSAPAVAATVAAGGSGEFPLIVLVGVVAAILVVGAIVALVYAVRRTRADRELATGGDARSLGSL